MLRAAVSSVIAIVLTTVVLGLAYPLVMTGFAQVAFKSQANGSLIEQNGKVIGSKLVAQGFSSSRYFHPRPNRGPPPAGVGGGGGGGGGGGVGGGG